MSLLSLDATSVVEYYFLLVRGKFFSSNLQAFLSFVTPGSFKLGTTIYTQASIQTVQLRFVILFFFSPWTLFGINLCASRNIGVKQSIPPVTGAFADWQNFGRSLRLCKRFVGGSLRHATRSLKKANLSCLAHDAA
jgi:hypothetical protein